MSIYWIDRILAEGRPGQWDITGGNGGDMAGHQILKVEILATLTSQGFAKFGLSKWGKEVQSLVEKRVEKAWLRFGKWETLLIYQCVSSTKMCSVVRFNDYLLSAKNFMHAIKQPSKIQ